ncbi:protein kinase domain-containing protein [Desulfotruncus alcoholivorax]|uniref:protein kinase domain-containing protein n=1 Tax=Desulfotruncus alcoholivorax TaxID=265477 RepID=UPI00041EB9B0|nr:protein kinase [Desulfotruncus alcoholivorax]
MIKARRNNSLYAIKALINKAEDVELFLAHKLEADILSRLNHPRIPGFVNAFTYNDVHYIIQEYIEGLPLSYYIHNGCRFDEGEVKPILFQLLSILDYLHCPSQKENAVVHRDLRLSNILLNSSKIYLLDFGLARYLDPAKFPYVPDPVSGNNSECLNSPASPRIPGAETYRLLRRDISPKSDLFGVGVVGVDLFTNLVENPNLNAPWQKVLPLSIDFINFLKKLLSQKNNFKSASEAMMHLELIQ